MRILPIEDDASMVDYLVKGLKESGFVVDRAADGREELFLAASGPYDVLIVDRCCLGSILWTFSATLAHGDQPTPPPGHP